MTIPTRLSAIAIAVSVQCFALATSASAATEPAPIFTAPVGAHEASKSKSYAINPELGRAWVEIDIVPSLSETSESHRVVVPGLSYQPQTAQVVFEAEGRSVVCADVHDAGRWIFKHQRIVPTGNCLLSPRYVQVIEDDGFGVDQIDRFEVRLEVRDGAGDAAPGIDRQG